MTIARATIYALTALFFLLAMTVGAAGAGTPVAQASTDDDALQLLVIELFFLLVGLLIAAFLGYLVWQSWRKKKASEKGK
jgi:hypothetical protein